MDEGLEKFKKENWDWIRKSREKAALYRKDPNMKRVQEELETMVVKLILFKETDVEQVFHYLDSLGVNKMYIVHVPEGRQVVQAYMETIHNVSFTFNLVGNSVYNYQLYIRATKLVDGPLKEGQKYKESIPHYEADRTVRRMPDIWEGNQPHRGAQQFLNLLGMYYEHLPQRLFIRRQKRIAIAEATDKAILDLRKTNNETAVYDRTAIRRILEFAGLPVAKKPLPPKPIKFVMEDEGDEGGGGGGGGGGVKRKRT